MFTDYQKSVLSELATKNYLLSVTFVEETAYFSVCIPLTEFRDILESVIFAEFTISPKCAEAWKDYPRFLKSVLPVFRHRPILTSIARVLQSDDDREFLEFLTKKVEPKNQLINGIVL